MMNPLIIIYRQRTNYSRSYGIKSNFEVQDTPRKAPPVYVEAEEIVLLSLPHIM
jgi:hypothetical protein